MKFSAFHAMNDKRIERGLKRAARYAKWKHDPTRKPTAAELARRYRQEVVKKR